MQSCAERERSGWAIGSESGILLNRIGIVLITACIYLFGTAVLGIDLGQVPDWGTSISSGATSP